MHDIACISNFWQILFWYLDMLYFVYPFITWKILKRVVHINSLVPISYRKAFSSNNNVCTIITIVHFFCLYIIPISFWEVPLQIIWFEWEIWILKRTLVMLLIMNPFHSMKNCIAPGDLLSPWIVSFLIFMLSLHCKHKKKVNWSIPCYN